MGPGHTRRALKTIQFVGEYLLGTHGMMLVRLGLMAVAVTGVLAGCVSGPPPLTAGAQSAEVSFQVDNDSVHYTGRNIAIDTYPDLTCKERRIIARKVISAGASEKFGPYAFQASQPLIFEILYAESRFAQNRTCAVRASFVPESNKHYNISFHSVDQVAHCGIAIRETDSEQDHRIAAQFPARACFGNLKNGQPDFIQWHLQMTPIPRGK